MILIYDGYEQVAFENDQRTTADRYFAFMAHGRCSTHVLMRRDGTVLREHQNARHDDDRCWCTSDVLPLLPQGPTDPRFPQGRPGWERVTLVTNPQ